MEPAYLNWRQTDPRFNQHEAWPRDAFPGASFRWFRDAGCLVCALAVLLRSCGAEPEGDEALFNPWILNRRLIGCGAFDSAADLDLSGIRRLYPLEYLGPVPYSRAALARFAGNGFPCLVTVPGKNAEKHFTALTGILRDDAEVYDPLTGLRRVSSCGRVLEIRPFRKN